MCILGDKGKDNQQDSIFSLLHSVNKGPGQYHLHLEIQPFGTSVLCQFYSYAAAAKSLQSCLTLCDPIDGSPRGSPVPGVLQARTLEWVAISFSNAWKWKVKVKLLSLVQLLATPWTAAHQAPRPWDFLGKSTGVGCHCLLRFLR